jgi:hypothetical protein
MRRIVLAAFALTVLAACGDAFSPESVSGFYQLLSISGNALPYSETITEDGVTAEMTINAGSVTLNENGTFSTSMDFEIISDVFTGDQTLTSSGTFTLVEPATVQFTNEFDEQWAGTLDGDRLTVGEEAGSYVYER